MSLSLTYAEERARDALAFEPLPPSPWVSVDDKAIRVVTPYHPDLVALLKRLGGTWDSGDGRWRVPFVARTALVATLPEIERLAVEATAQHEEIDARRQAQRAADHARRETERIAAERRRALSSPPRPFRHEFLVSRAGAPRHWLEIEAIGDDVTRLPGLRGSAGWVAQIFGGCPHRGFQRAFLRGAKDYAAANSRGSRGVMLSYALEEGPIYEIKQRTSWRHVDRWFLRIWDGKRRRMTEDEVRACLESTG